MTQSAAAMPDYSTPEWKAAIAAQFAQDAAMTPDERASRAFDFLALRSTP